jgi:2-methylcitrate dehydratase PrpD
VRLKEQHALAVDRITAIRIVTFHEATRLAVRAPRTTEEAQYSLPFPVAAALVFGALGPGQLTGDALHDPRVLRLAERIELREDPDFSREFPARQFAHVAIDTKEGGRFEVLHAEPRWDSTAPPALAELQAKFRWLTQFVSAEAARTLEETIIHCADLPDAAVLAEQLTVLPRAVPSTIGNTTT